MPARTTRAQARARILGAFKTELDRLIPEEEGAALKGSRFADFEEQGTALARASLPAFLEERAALACNARVEAAGRCPHCGSDRVYLEKQETTGEMLSPHGPVAVPKQQARCRACGGSFSPSGSGLGPAHGSSVDAARGAAGGSRGDAASVRPGGPGAE